MTGAVYLGIHFLLAVVCASVARSMGRRAGAWFLAGLFFGLPSLLLVAFAKPKETTPRLKPTGETPLLQLVVGFYPLIGGLLGAIACVVGFFVRLGSADPSSSWFGRSVDLFLISLSGAVSACLFTVGLGLMGGQWLFSSRVYWVCFAFTPVLGLGLHLWMTVQGGGKTEESMSIAVFCGIATLIFAIGGAIVGRKSEAQT